LRRKKKVAWEEKELPITIRDQPLVRKKVTAFSKKCMRICNTNILSGEPVHCSNPDRLAVVLERPDFAVQACSDDD
jgi:hypothetical protein